MLLIGLFYLVIGNIMLRWGLKGPATDSEIRDSYHTSYSIGVSTSPGDLDMESRFSKPLNSILQHGQKNNSN